MILKLKYECLMIQVIRLAPKFLKKSKAGLSIGDPVIRTGRTLSIELGPGVLGNFYDGIQRSTRNGTHHIPRGICEPALNRDTNWFFEPKTYKVIKHRWMLMILSDW